MKHNACLEGVGRNFQTDQTADWVGGGCGLQSLAVLWDGLQSDFSLITVRNFPSLHRP
jgi:hypothetical protein